MPNIKPDKYRYMIIWSEDDKEHVGLCLEFPGLSWLAKTPYEALRGIIKVVADCIADMREDGEQIPKPIEMTIKRFKVPPSLPFP